MPTLTQRAEQLRKLAAEQNWPFFVHADHPVYELADPSWKADEDARAGLRFTYGLLCSRLDALETIPADAPESRGHTEQDINLLIWRLLHHRTARPTPPLTAVDPVKTEAVAPVGGVA